MGYQIRPAIRVQAQPIRVVRETIRVINRKPFRVEPNKHITTKPAKRFHMSPKRIARRDAIRHH